MKKTIILFTLMCLSVSLSAQEALKSTEEEYYDFLSLTGITERPTLGYRTLSDSEWNFIEENNAVLDESGKPILDEDGNEVTTNTTPSHPWQNNNLGKKRTLWQSESKGENWFMNGIDQSIKAKIYGPEWFNSYNTASPYGQNDGALWQGKGYNTSFTAGARLEGYGFEVTVKPQVSFSQNREFDYFTSTSMQGSNYTDKANLYGYLWGVVDTPQRFGDSSFWTFDWGDTEVRYTWHTFTVGFGTQSPWIGPAWLNPVLHSNNAATYPKVDVGIRKTEIYLPFLNWDLGSIEGRIWIGRTTESEYFDNDSSNDHNMIHGLSMSYKPSFLPGLTIGANRTCLVKWKWSNLKHIIPSEDNYVGPDASEGEDQKASFTADWIFPVVGFEVYGELGFDDGLHFNSIPQHARTYTAGAKKAISLSKKYNLDSEIIFEWNCTEMSQDFQLQWPYNFGFHHHITQGYTNQGQWIGAGSGYGGRGFYIGYRVYHPKGSILGFFHHWQPDNNFIYSKAVNASADDGELNKKYIRSWKTFNTFGLTANYFFAHSFLAECSILYDRNYEFLVC
ncbi:MAG: capsule assembly Wzi family protein [Treponema sp.]|nr:capsule assembly Wzi family protein [Treponema sp.]